MYDTGTQIGLLLDGLRDEIKKNRLIAEQQTRRKHTLRGGPLAMRWRSHLVHFVNRKINCLCLLLMEAFIVSLYCVFQMLGELQAFLAALIRPI